MKILVISNFYPPHAIGGYELACRDVVDGLRSRGHDIKVLTSTYGLSKPQSDGFIYRWLRHNLGRIRKSHLQHVSLLRREWTNQRAFRRLVRRFRPEVLYMWNPVHISMSLLAYAQEIGLPVCYFVGDEWLVRFSARSDPWFKLCNRKGNKFLSRIAKPFVMQLVSGCGLLSHDLSVNFTHVQFASNYLKTVSLRALGDISDPRVIYNGIVVERFRREKARDVSCPRLVYVGRIAPEKGVHTAIEAVRVLRDEHGYIVTLDIVGEALDMEYLRILNEMIQQASLQHTVHFRGFIARECLPDVYAEHDILIFPSVWEEPLGMTPLEAMCSGLVVVATGTGGSSEFLQDGVNALLFTRENAHECAGHIRRLLEDRRLLEAIRQAGRRTVNDRFQIQLMIDNVERALFEALNENHIASSATPEL